MMTSKDYISREEKYGAHNYQPLPVVLERGEGYSCGMWKEKVFRLFIILLNINQGHCHPKLWMLW